MKKRYTWNEVQEKALENMTILAERIEFCSDEKALYNLNVKLAQANSAYEENKRMIANGEECPYIYYEGED